MRREPNTALAAATRPVRCLSSLSDVSLALLVVSGTGNMSDAMNVDPAVPPGPAAAEGYVSCLQKLLAGCADYSSVRFRADRAAHPQVPAEASPSPDPEVLALLASTQNECLAELGYRPTLLQEFRDLEKTCAMLTADNQKLYADNRSLALFIQQQDQRLSLLQTPTDQQKIHIAQMHEQLRVLATERDEISGRLHHAYVFQFTLQRCVQSPRAADVAV